MLKFILQTLQRDRSVLIEHAEHFSPKMSGHVDARLDTICIRQLEKRGVIQRNKTDLQRSKAVISVASIVFEHTVIHARLMDEFGDVLFDYYTDGSAQEPAFWIRHIFAEFRKERFVPLATSVVLPNELFCTHEVDPSDKNLFANQNVVLHKLKLKTEFGCRAIEEDTGIPLLLMPNLYAEYWSSHVHRYIHKRAIDFKKNTDTYMKAGPLKTDYQTIQIAQQIMEGITKITHPWIFVSQGQFYIAHTDDYQGLVTDSFQNTTAYDAINTLQNGLLHAWLLDLFYVSDAVLTDVVDAFATAYAFR